ncbi:hypothetical protein Zmor_015158 [Zophobas morio]|uniref:Uncharacterized protein n=1 Tax=Zophobas morio TaxID=2755281 RepID=A0AA38IGN7_9CUCU|nr:hypothetical protein Zmor_015158 [Zophobas morio]
MNRVVNKRLHLHVRYNHSSIILLNRKCAFEQIKKVNNRVETVHKGVVWAQLRGLLLYFGHMKRRNIKDECFMWHLKVPKWCIIIKSVEMTEKFIICEDITCNSKITTCVTVVSGALVSLVYQMTALIQSAFPLPSSHTDL